MCLFKSKQISSTSFHRINRVKSNGWTWPCEPFHKARALIRTYLVVRQVAWPATTIMLHRHCLATLSRLRCLSNSRRSRISDVERVPPLFGGGVVCHEQSHHWNAPPHSRWIFHLCHLLIGALNTTFPFQIAQFSRDISPRLTEAMTVMVSAKRTEWTPSTLSREPNRINRKFEL